MAEVDQYSRNINDIINLFDTFKNEGRQIKGFVALSILDPRHLEGTVMCLTNLEKNLDEICKLLTRLCRDSPVVESLQDQQSSRAFELFSAFDSRMEKIERCQELITGQLTEVIDYIKRLPADSNDTGKLEVAGEVQQEQAQT